MALNAISIFSHSELNNVPCPVNLLSIILHISAILLSVQTKGS